MLSDGYIFRLFLIILQFVKPPEAQYIGFGEQGGQHLVKNEEQVTYFNYDNMRYRQVTGSRISSLRNFKIV